MLVLKSAIELAIEKSTKVSTAFRSRGTTHRSTVTGTCRIVASLQALLARMLLTCTNIFDTAVAEASLLNVVELYMSEDIISNG